MSFADRLKQAMKEQMVSQADLSKITGISRSRISQYHSGIYTPRRGAIKQIADALNVPVCWLIGEIEETEPSVSLPYAAKLMNVLPQMLREGLKNRKYPFGYAVKKSNGRFRYYISPKRFTEFTGIAI